MALRKEIEEWLHAELAVATYKDYGPNGLQVEGRAEVFKVVSGVTASLAFIEAALAAGADALLVHHGLFWRGQEGRLTGWLGQRVKRLMQHDLNLFAYHLPLDAHAQWGNNTQLGQRLGLQAQARFGEQSLGFLAAAPGEWSAGGLQSLLQEQLGRAVLRVGGDDRPIRRVAWCTGGAQGYFEAAVAAGADAFITGEISEPQAHLARETGVHYFACGHHASERYGVQALGQAVAERFGVIHQFIEIDNPA